MNRGEFPPHHQWTPFLLRRPPTGPPGAAVPPDATPPAKAVAPKPTLQTAFPLSGDPLKGGAAPSSAFPSLRVPLGPPGAGQSPAPAAGDQPALPLEARVYRAAGKLQGKIALISGTDGEIGKAAAIAFAWEGADLAIIHPPGHAEADALWDRIEEEEGRRCLRIAGDVSDPAFCREAVEEAVATFGRLDVLVNSGSREPPRMGLLEKSREQLERTFRTNVFSMFDLTKAALPHLKKGAAIINTASVIAYAGHPALIDYASAEGAIVAFTRSLALSLAPDGIRVNAVAPGPIWTPSAPSGPGQYYRGLRGENTPLGRAGYPEEVAPCYVFLACEDSSYMTGQVLHPNGGVIVNG